MKDKRWRSEILLLLLLWCMAGCSENPRAPHSSSESSAVAVQEAVVSSSSSSSTSASVPLSESESGSDASSRQEPILSDVLSDTGSESARIPTAGALQEGVLDPPDREGIRLYEAVGSGERRALEGEAWEVPLFLDSQPATVKRYPLQAADYQGKTPMFTTAGGEVQIFDIIFPQEERLRNKVMQMEVVVNKQTAFLLEVPCLDRSVSDPVMVLTAGGRLVIPTSRQGVLIFSFTDEEASLEHRAFTWTISGNERLPHRLLGFLYDQEKERFLLLHTKEVDVTVADPDLEHMMLTIYDAAWNPLEVYDTGLLPFADKETGFPQRYTFKLMEEPGLVVIGAESPSQELIVVYE